MAEKLYDICIKVGEYQTNDGTKPRFKTIGSLFNGDKGKYVALDSSALSMQLNYIANKEQKERIIAGVFEAREKSYQKPAQHSKQEDKGFNDNIPF